MNLEGAVGATDFTDDTDQEDVEEKGPFTQQVRVTSASDGDETVRICAICGL